MSAAARFRCTLVAGATAVVIGSGLTVAGLSRHADAQATVPTAADRPLAASTSADVSGSLLADLTAATAPTASAVPSAPVSTAAAAAASPTADTTVTKKKTVAAKPRTTKTTKAATGTAPATSGSILDQVLAHINAARAAEGRSALTLDTALSTASALHNQLMIDGCGLAHVCPGESGLGERFTAQGVKWSSAGENIGYSSSGSSDADIIEAANGMCDSMLAEVAPNDGHRQNLLNTGFKRIGLSVLRDGKGITWLTQDFVN